jgi:hypothetical protein
MDLLITMHCSYTAHLNVVSNEILMIVYSFDSFCSLKLPDIISHTIYECTMYKQI